MSFLFSVFKEQPSSAVSLRFVLEWTWNKVICTKDELDQICEYWCSHVWALEWFFVKIFLSNLPACAAGSWGGCLDLLGLFSVRLWESAVALLPDDLISLLDKVFRCLTAPATSLTHRRYSPFSTASCFWATWAQSWTVSWQKPESSLREVGESTAGPLLWWWRFGRVLGM